MNNSTLSLKRVRLISAGLPVFSGGVAIYAIVAGLIPVSQLSTYLYFGLPLLAAVFALPFALPGIKEKLESALENLNTRRLDRIRQWCGESMKSDAISGATIQKFINDIDDLTNQYHFVNYPRAAIYVPVAILVSIPGLLFQTGAGVFFSYVVFSWALYLTVKMFLVIDWIAKNG